MHNRQTQHRLLQLIQRGIELHRQGKLPEARQMYESAIKINPRHNDLLYLLGSLYGQEGNYPRSVEFLAQAVKATPSNALAWINYGNALRKTGDLHAAVASYDKAIRIDPGLADAHYNRGNAFQDLQQLEAALASFDKAIDIDPHLAQAHSNRSVALLQLNQPEAALASCDQAIRIAPGFAAAHSNRGNALAKLNRFAEAIASYDRAIAISPDFASAYSNRGAALRELKQVDQALASCDKAIRIAADHVDAHWNKSLVALLAGDFANGWQLYEWRWKRSDPKTRPRNFPRPLWLGREDIKGKTILLHSEQGLGDTLQFCRYVSMVKALGASVILNVPRALLGLLENLEGVDALFEEGSAMPDFDYHCPLLSLPLAFQTTAPSIPRQPAHIHNRRDKVRHWEHRLGAPVKKRIGFAWSGSATHDNDHNRSIPLEQIIPFLSKDIEYICLQNDVRPADRDALQRSAIRYFGNELRDFTDTAALCTLVDLVVSVDTSVAHLAGTLGKQTWVLLPYVPDWRWLLDRDDTPWYSTMRLYRQNADRKWTSVLTKVAGDWQKDVPKA